MLALLPLALAAIVVNWQSIRTAEREKTELMEAATQQTAAQLASNISVIRNTQILTANVLAFDPNPGNICERMQRLYHSMVGEGGIVHVIFDREKRIRCASPGGAAMLATLGDAASGTVKLMQTPGTSGLVLQAQSRDGSLTVLTLYRQEAIQRTTMAGLHDPQQSVVLIQNGRHLWLSDRRAGNTQGLNGVVTEAKVGKYPLSIALVMAPNQESAGYLALLMPVALWLAAGFLGWLVVRSVLIQPLIALRGEVADYVPGKVITPPRVAGVASAELAELGQAFHDMSKDVAEHEEEMREALSRQTKLTREVHHRVKNNLQIISSLISLHWRSAGSPEMAGCYLSIQRRVDALAVVQRNHYAELDEERGVRARAMLNEISSGLKTSAQVQSKRDLDVSVRCDDVYLHQDVAAPIAFMAAELADLVIALETGGQLDVSLTRLPDDSERARFAVSSAAFQRPRVSDANKVELYERVLTGLSRQLRAPLEHDVETGEYHIIVPVTG